MNLSVEMEEREKPRSPLLTTVYWGRKRSVWKMGPPESPKQESTLPLPPKHTCGMDKGETEDAANEKQPNTPQTRTFKMLLETLERLDNPSDSSL